jgi:hypothetical protein
LTSGKRIQTIRYADHQFIIAKSEDELQMAVNKLNKIAKKCKTKTIGLRGKDVQRVKIEIKGKIIKRVSNFKYLGYIISNEEKDINITLQRYNKMNEIIKCHLFLLKQVCDIKARIGL